MATSYLDLTNELLRELNEVPLSSGDFGQALGRFVSSGFRDVWMYRRLDCLQLACV